MGNGSQRLISILVTLLPPQTAPEDVMLMLWQFSARFDIAVAKVAGTRVAS